MRACGAPQVTKDPSYGLGWFSPWSAKASSQGAAPWRKEKEHGRTTVEEMGFGVGDPKKRVTPNWVVLENGNQDLNLRSNSWWCSFDPYPFLHALCNTTLVIHNPGALKTSWSPVTELLPEDYKATYATHEASDKFADHAIQEELRVEFLAA